MFMAGRRPKPTAIKVLTGNPGGRPLNDLEPQALPGEPEMPKGMSKSARREWKRIVPELLRLGVLSIIDGKALAAYCECFARCEEARREIDKHGLVVEEPILDKEGEEIGTKFKANPAVNINLAYMKQMKSFLIEFGLTPASRTKLKIEKPAESDPFEALMAGRQVPGVTDQKPV